MCWWVLEDSNPYRTVSKTDMISSFTKDPLCSYCSCSCRCLEYRVRFELTALRICNPFPWATRASVHNWQGYVESNHGQQSQSLLCYHYTIPHQTWRKTEESNPIRFLGTWFSRPVAGPTPLHHLPNTLSRQCAYQNALLRIHFDTLPFYTFWLSPRTYHQVGRPHYS